MAKDLDYVGGIIAAKENGLLKDKIFALCESDAQSAFRSLSESGFGAGAEVDSAFGYEKILRADEEDIDKFAREYAANNAQKAYIFLWRDFHNAKSLLKAARLNLPPDKMLAPEGLYTVDTLEKVIAGGETDVCPQLKEAVETAQKLFEEKGENTSGAEVGAIFEKGAYSALFTLCKRSPLLKKLLQNKADMTNILTVMRSNTLEYAANNAISGGKIDVKRMLALFSENGEEAEKALDKTYLEDFWKECFLARNKGLPFTAAEKKLASADTDFLAAHKYELKRGEPFLYYIFRRRAENENVRIVLSCLLAGMDGEEIKPRLRSF